MKIYATINRKGGVGKTTTAVSLAAALAEAGERVLLIDLDPQANASGWLGFAESAKDRRLLEVLEGNLTVREAILPTGHERLDLLPAGRALEAAEAVLGREPRSDEFLRVALDELRDESGEDASFTRVIIDCPPSGGYLLNVAMVAASHLVVPVEARYMALEGLADFLGTVYRLRRVSGQPLPFAAILACRVDRRNIHSQEVAERIAGFVESQLDGVPFVEVRENIALSEASAAHQPITSFAPTSAGAEDHRRLAEILRSQDA